MKNSLLSFTIEYDGHYDSDEIRGVDVEDRPWDLKKTILEYSGKDKKLLDVGCGTAFKLIPIAPYFNEIVGIDSNNSMLKAAKLQINSANINNIILQQANAHHLIFKDETFDVVTCMLSRWTVSELHRVLKKGGVVIIEHLGCSDKAELKKYFELSNDATVRGQYLEYKEDEYLQSFEDIFCKYFDIIQFTNGFWETEYTHRGICMLLKYTPAVKNYDEVKDRSYLEKAVKELTHGDLQRKVRLKQNRVFLVAKKRE